MGGNEKNEIFRQMRRELKYFNTLSRETICLEEDGYKSEVLKALSESNYLVLAKTRQMMISTLLCAHAIKRALFNKKHTVLIIASNNMTKKYLMGIVNNILSHSSLPSTTEENKISIYAGGDIIFASISSIDSLQGRHVDTLIFDEAAYSTKLEGVLGVLLSQLNPGPGSQVVIASTPKHNSYFNYLFLSASNDPESPYTTKKLVYSDNPYMTTEKITALSRSNYKDEELLCHVTHKSFKVKTKLVVFRLDRKLLNKVKDKLSTGDISMTDYLRRLIEKDIG